MPKFIKIRLNYDRTLGKRIEVEAELLEDRGTTILVKLPDGNKISRKKLRDLVDETS